MNDVTSQVQAVTAAQPLDVPHAAVAPHVTAVPRLRLWPGVAIVVLQWLLILVPSRVLPDEQMMMVFFATMAGNVLGLVGVLVWWLGFSRVPLRDRVLVVLGCEFIAANAALFFNPTIGMFTMLLFGFAMVTTAWVVWLLLTGFLSWPTRKVGLLVVFVLAWGYFDLIRFDGATGSLDFEMNWRWTPKPEDLFVAERKATRSKSLPAEKVDAVTTAAAVGLGTIPHNGFLVTWTTETLREADQENAKPLTLQPGDWPGFRGPNRDGRRTGTRIATDWKQNPPRELWRHRVGPGWSSFAVVGDHLFTQQQEDKEELVVCYNAGTGKEIWTHRDPTRFTEEVAGAGPRATPTFHDGKIYALGANGHLNCLNAVTGQLIWQQDILRDSRAKVPPHWGFSSSPLVMEGVVTVFAGGPEGKSVLGYRASSGKLAWSAGKGLLSYCSPHPANLGGVPQVMITTEEGLTAFHPTRGRVIWEHDWTMPDQQARVVQPAVLGDTDVLIGSGFSTGTRRVHATPGRDSWASEEVWTTRAIKPYFNDLVIHQGHLYGFDNAYFTCVNLEDGKGKWRARGYDNGQVLLLADQGLLLVLSEKGAVALVEATPEKHRELGRFQAIKGKTWNHPVLANGRLFVRNGEEAACYQLKEEGAAGLAGK